MKTPFITEAEALKEDFKGRTNYWMCHPDVTNAKDLQVCRAVLPAGECHNFHHHPELEEAIYVLEGEVEQWVGEEKQLLKDIEQFMGKEISVMTIKKGDYNETISITEDTPNDNWRLLLEEAEKEEKARKRRKK